MISLEQALIGAENAARKVFLDADIEVTGLMIHLAFSKKDQHFAAASKTPHPAPPHLGQLLYDSALEAGASA